MHCGRGGKLELKMTDPIQYLTVRMNQLDEELAKNPSEENIMIIGKAVSELSIVLDLLKRERLLSGEPYKDGDPAASVTDLKGSLDY